MARPRRAKFVEVEEVAEPIESTRPVPQVQGVLDALADEGQRTPEARISRMDPLTSKLSFLETVDAALVTDAWMRENYGGGEFQVMVYGTREDGTYGFLRSGSKRFRIDSSIPFKGAIRERAAAGAINAEPAAERNPAGASQSIIDMGVMQLFKSMQDNSAMMARQATDHSTMMMALMERLAQPQKSALPELLGVLTPLLTPLIGNLVGKKDPMEIATQLAALMKDSNGPRQSVNDTLETLTTLMELRDRLGGGDKSDEVTVLSTVKELAPQALQLLQSMAARPAANQILANQTPPRSMPRAPQPILATPPNGVHPFAPAPFAPAPSAPQPVEGQPTVAPDEWTPLEGPMTQLIQQARTNKPPHRVAAMVLLLANDEQQATLREVVAQDDVMNVITHRFPAFQSYQTWLGEFVMELRGEMGLLPDEDEDTIAEGEDATTPLPPEGGE
jgi:hypothetical protein